jgi:hypothetical protein
MGERRKCAKCPVAIAISSNVDSRLAVYAWGSNGGGIRVPGCGEIFLFRLPDNAHQFIRDFDALRPVQPFTFPLTLPAEYWREQSTADQIVDASESNKVTVGGNGKSV